MQQKLQNKKQISKNQKIVIRLSKSDKILHTDVSNPF